MQMVQFILRSCVPGLHPVFQVLIASLMKHEGSRPAALRHLQLRLSAPCLWIAVDERVYSATRKWAPRLISETVAALWQLFCDVHHVFRIRRSAAPLWMTDTRGF
jgi:hypothetical protein